MLRPLRRFIGPISPDRQEAIAQVLASATLFLAGYGLAGILIDVARMAG